MSRIEQLEGFAQANPKDPFPRYGLALEYKNLGRLEDAIRSFQELMRTFPDYIPSFLHAGAVLAELGRKDEARAAYQAGIEVTTRKQDFHARGELEAALADLLSRST